MKKHMENEIETADYIADPIGVDISYQKHVIQP